MHPLHGLLASLFLCLTGAAQGPAGAMGRYRDLVFPQAAVTSDLVYGQAVNRTSLQQETLLLDLYEPAGDTAPARPAVVIAHGGSFIFGNKTVAEYVQLATDLARRGFVAVSIDYRKGFPPLSGVRQDAALDMKAAVRWLRANAATHRIDTNRIVVVGASAGAFMALSVAYANLGEGMSGNPGFSSQPQAVVDLWGTLEDLNGMQAGDVPVQIVHGTNDGIVPYQSALDIQARATQVGVYHELFPIQGAGHSPWTQYFSTYLPETVGFLYEQLQLGELAGLELELGVPSPGFVTVETFGSAGDIYVVAVANSLVATPVPGIGVADIGPAATLILLAQGVLPTGSRLGSASTGTSVPTGVPAGITVHLQALHLDATGALFTNTVPFTF